MTGGSAESRATTASTERTVYGGDRKLVRALLTRNRKAAAEFVSLYTDPVYAYVYQRMVPRTDLVDDLVQEVFLAAWDSLVRFEGKSSLKTWLLGIARHKVEDYYRSRLRQLVSLDEGDEGLSEPAEEPEFDLAIDRSRAMLRTRSVLEDLPETSRLLLQWRYWEKRSLREMADGIGRSEKAVERALARARQDFRRRWEHDERA
jgi:RNA polymerase sigma-70 factor, ECF subfamily